MMPSQEQKIREEVQQEVQKYLILFSGLLGFTIITVAATYLHLTVPQILILGAVVLCIKGMFVAATFLKIIPAHRAVHILLIFTAIFLVSILLLPIVEKMIALHGTAYVP